MINSKSKELFCAEHKRKTNFDRLSPSCSINDYGYFKGSLNYLLKSSIPPCDGNYIWNYPSEDDRLNRGWSMILFLIEKQTLNELMRA